MILQLLSVGFFKKSTTYTDRIHLNKRKPSPFSYNTPSWSNPRAERTRAQGGGQALFQMREKSDGGRHSGPASKCLPCATFKSHAHAQPLLGSGVGQQNSGGRCNCAGPGTKATGACRGAIGRVYLARLVLGTQQRRVGCVSITPVETTSNATEESRGSTYRLCTRARDRHRKKPPSTSRSLRPLSGRPSCVSAGLSG